MELSQILRGQGVAGHLGWLTGVQRHNSEGEAEPPVHSEKPVTHS